MAKKMTLKQKIFLVGAIIKGNGGNVPGSDPDNLTPEFTFITDENGAILITENNLEIVTENSQT